MNSFLFVGNGAVEAETETGEIEEVNIGLEIGKSHVSQP